MDIFVVQKKGMAVVTRMLAECLPMIAVNYPDRILLHASRAQAIGESAERSVAVMQGVTVLIDLRPSRKGAAFRRGIGMMARDGQVGEEETLPARQRVDPRQHS